MYWNANNASNPYITDCKRGLACPGSYLYLPADAGRTLFTWGGFSPSAVLNRFGFLFWSIYQQRSKANFLFQVSSQYPSRQKRKLSRLPPPSRGTLSLGRRNVLTYPYCLSYYRFLGVLSNRWHNFFRKNGYGSVLTSSHSYLWSGNEDILLGNWSRMFKMLGRTENQVFIF